MALITLNIQVEELATVLSNFDRIKVYRSTTGLSGVYSEITGPSTRLVLTAGQAVYSYDDLSGAATYYYCVSYYNSTTLSESSKSEPTPGERDPALDLMSADDVKSLYLYGLDLTNDAGVPIPDSTYEFYIKAAVSWIESRLDIKIPPTTITGETQDFYKNDYNRYIMLQTDHIPILEVSRIEMVLPNQQSVLEYQTDWIYELKESGMINIIPGSGAASVVTLGLSGGWLPFAYGRTKHLPSIFQLDYTAGWARGTTPAVLLDCVGMYASFGPLGILGDLLGGAGIASQSISLDGLNQSFNTTSSATNAGYGARIIQFQKQLKDILPQLRRTFHPVGLAVV